MLRLALAAIRRIEGLLQLNGNFETTLMRGNTVGASAGAAAGQDVVGASCSPCKRLLETANAHSTGMKH
ncbi:hypothetical protein [Paraburkholderia sp. RAU2J]|uniref:hypothetical protein n=1 Tax=Paraburkholderia sp. RAU2J TaxID=1938810 RepID=UPI0011C415FF|nr:hypothetical protein [Paraburkholderia sp. RAU2J]